MKDFEKDYLKRRRKLNAFEQDLKEVFAKHNVELKRELEDWGDCEKEVIKIYIDFRIWNIYDFQEVLNKINVIH